MAANADGNDDGVRSWHDSERDLGCCRWGMMYVVVSIICCGGFCYDYRFESSLRYIASIWAGSFKLAEWHSLPKSVSSLHVCIQCKRLWSLSKFSCSRKLIA